MSTNTGVSACVCLCVPACVHGAHLCAITLVVACRLRWRCARYRGAWDPCVDSCVRAFVRVWHPRFANTNAVGPLYRVSVTAFETCARERNKSKMAAAVRKGACLCGALLFAACSRRRWSPTRQPCQKKGSFCFVFVLCVCVWLRFYYTVYTQTFL